MGFCSLFSTDLVNNICLPTFDVNFEISHDIARFSYAIKETERKVIRNVKRNCILLYSFIQPLFAQQKKGNIHTENFHNKAINYRGLYFLRDSLNINLIAIFSGLGYNVGTYM